MKAFFVIIAIFIIGVGWVLCKSYNVKSAFQAVQVNTELTNVFLFSMFFLIMACIPDENKNSKILEELKKMTGQLENINDNLHILTVHSKDQVKQKALSEMPEPTITDDLYDIVCPECESQYQSKEDPTGQNYQCLNCKNNFIA